MIARMWRGWVATDRAAEYVADLTKTALAEYRQTPGNLTAQMWSRDLGDGRTEVVAASWWESLEAIEGFAGEDSAFAPDGLLDKETTVSHYEVA
jgi:heme-degrading monooxygenase HmoA